MKETIQKLYYSNILVIVISVLMFGYGLYTHTINEIILYLLEFTVIFELVRAFNHYMKDGQLKVRYAIDAAIFYSIKELYIGFTSYKIDNSYGLILIAIIVITVLMVVRYFNSTIIEEKAKICNVPGSCDKNGL